MERLESSRSSLWMRVLAVIVLAVAAWLALKLIIGVLATIAWIAAAGVAVFGVVWALKVLRH